MPTERCESSTNVDDAIIASQYTTSIRTIKGSGDSRPDSLQSSRMRAEKQSQTNYMHKHIAADISMRMEEFLFPVFHLSASAISVFC